MLAVLPIMIWNIRQANTRDGRALRWPAARARASSAASASTSPCSSSSRSGPSRRSASWSRRCATRTRSSPPAGGTPSPAPARPRPAALPPASAQVEKDGKFVIEGNIFERRPAREHQRLRHPKSAAPTEFAAGTVADLGDGVTLQLNADGTFVMTSPNAFEGDARPAHLLRLLRAAALHHRELRDGAVFGRHRPLLHQLADRDHPGDRHPDPDRRLRRLCAGLDALSRPRAAHRRHHRPAGRAAADVADPAAAALQRRRPVLRRAVEDLSRHLAGAYRLRPALRHLPAAQLHGRPAARDDGIGAHRRRQRFRDLHQDRAAAVLPGARLLRHLPVPLGLERPAGRHGVPRLRHRPAGADRQASTRCSARAAATGKSSRPRPSSPSSCR